VTAAMNRTNISRLHRSSFTGPDPAHGRSDPMDTLAVSRHRATGTPEPDDIEDTVVGFRTETRKRRSEPTFYPLACHPTPGASRRPRIESASAR
jgi:hypothetical protein